MLAKDLRHPGKSFCILGGAPSLRADLEQIEADIYISANEHGVLVRECDYIIAMDVNHGSGESMEAVLRRLTDTPVISPEPWADYQLTKWPERPQRLHSGLIGAYVAGLMGASVVYLAGMDAYGGKPAAMRQARRMAARMRCPVRAVSGPLTEIFPA